MPGYCTSPSRLALLYLAECSYGKLGREFQATDRDANSRAEIIKQIRNGSIDVVKVLEIDENEGTCKDVTAELIAEAQQERDPPSLDDLAEKMRGMLIDHERELRVYGW